MGRLVKRSKEQREADLNTLADLYVKQVPQMDIARRLGISQGQVSNDLKRLLRRWEDTRFHQIDRYKHEELRRINLIEAEMWECWEKSKVTAKVVINKGKSGVTDPDPKDKEYWRAGSTEELPVGGDMQYMNGVQWCVQQRIKILGIGAPTKIAQTDPTGQFEAGSSAKEELLGMLSGIIKRMKPETKEEQDWVEGELVPKILDETDNTVKDDSVPELARRLDMERMKKLPAAKPYPSIDYDQQGNIITEAVEVANEMDEEIDKTDDMLRIAALKSKLGIEV